MSTSESTPGNWPRLSQTLTDHPARPDLCQACGEKHRSGNPIGRWQECDDQDHPERVFVVLCRECAEEIIEDHPRLYVEINNVQVVLGCMSVCGDCKHRDRFNSCQSPSSSAHGGEGMWLHPAPQRVHICNRSKKGRPSGWYWLTQGVITECSGKEVNQ